MLAKVIGIALAASLIGACDPAALDAGPVTCSAWLACGDSCWSPTGPGSSLYRTDLEPAYFAGMQELAGGCFGACEPPSGPSTADLTTLYWLAALEQRASACAEPDPAACALANYELELDTHLMSDSRIACSASSWGGG